MSVQILRQLTPTLKEIRIHLCPNSSASNGARQFVDKYYIKLKEKNPDLPILIRECTSIEPKMWLRFEYGRETSTSLNNLNPDQIAGLLRDLDS